MIIVSLPGARARIAPIRSIGTEEARRQLLDCARGIAVLAMCSFRLKIEQLGNLSMAEVLSRPEVEALWHKCKTDTASSMFDQSTRGIFAIEEHRVMTIAAMDMEAERICQLDAIGEFNPRRLDDRSVTLVAFLQERSGERDS